MPEVTVSGGSLNYRNPIPVILLGNQYRVIPREAAISRAAEESPHFSRTATNQLWATPS
jgi:hypothetical protein